MRVFLKSSLNIYMSDETTKPLEKYKFIQNEITTVQLIIAATLIHHSIYMYTINTQYQLQLTIPAESLFERVHLSPQCLMY